MQNFFFEKFCKQKIIKIFWKILKFFLLKKLKIFSTKKNLLKNDRQEGDRKTKFFNTTFFMLWQKICFACEIINAVNFFFWKKIFWKKIFWKKIFWKKIFSKKIFWKKIFWKKKFRFWKKKFWKNFFGWFFFEL